MGDMSKLARISKVTKCFSPRNLLHFFVEADKTKIDQVNSGFQIPNFWELSYSKSLSPTLCNAWSWEYPQLEDIEVLPIPKIWVSVISEKHIHTVWVYESFVVKTFTPVR